MLAVQHIGASGELKGVRNTRLKPRRARLFKKVRQIDVRAVNDHIDVCGRARVSVQAYGDAPDHHTCSLGALKELDQVAQGS